MPDSLGRESSFLHPAQAVHAAKIHEGLEVADFGAGSGFFTRAAARAVGPQSNVWAIDAHADMLARLKSLAIAEGLHNVEVVRGDIEVEGGSNLPPQSMDFCIITNVLFSVHDKEGLIKEARRVLKRAGRVLVIDWSGSFGGLGPVEAHVVSEREARRLFEEAGFTYVEHVPAGAYHWGFVARKKAA